VCKPFAVLQVVFASREFLPLRLLRSSAHVHHRRRRHLRYMGGTDSIASADKHDLAKATQYVPQALAELQAGKPLSVAASEPYGCAVKYGP